MTNQPRSIIAYKDSEEATTRYFGPFVSESVADFFRASLPLPLKGGWAKRFTLQPFGAHDGHNVSQVILREREDA